jgi:hypothetical protein
VNYRHGQAFLSVVLLIGAIVLVVGTTIAFITVTFIDSSYGTQASQNAEAAAAGGVNDAQLRLVRGDIAAGGMYTVPVAATTATVTVTPNSPGPNLATVLSVATVLFRTRKIQAVFSIDPTTGQVSPVSWNEIQ